MNFLQSSGGLNNIANLATLVTNPEKYVNEIAADLVKVRDLVKSKSPSSSSKRSSSRSNGLSSELTRSSSSSIQEVGMSDVINDINVLVYKLYNNESPKEKIKNNMRITRVIHNKDKIIKIRLPSIINGKQDIINGENFTVTINWNKEGDILLSELIKENKDMEYFYKKNILSKQN